jgi:ribonuclease P protein component
LAVSGPAQIPVKRLKQRAEFLYVQGGGKAVRPALILEARRRAAPETPHIGVGFTASRKVGGAVERNRAKRRLREAARKCLPELGLGGVDYVFVARPATPEIAWARLLDDAQNALIRLRADLGADGEGSPRRPARPRPKTAAKRPAAPPQTESD